MAGDSVHRLITSKGPVHISYIVDPNDSDTGWLVFNGANRVRAKEVTFNNGKLDTGTFKLIFTSPPLIQRQK